MPVTYKDGAIVFEGSFFNETLYDAGNRLTNVQFDGRGGISRYAVINKFEGLDRLHFLIDVNGKPLDYSENKKVTMIGRKMEIAFSKNGTDMLLSQFLPDKKNCVLTELKITAREEDATVNTVINFGINFTSYMEQMFVSRLSPKTLIKAASGLLKKHIRIEEKAIRNLILGDFYFDIGSNEPIQPLEKGSLFCNQMKSSVVVKKGETKALRFALSIGTPKDFSYVDVEKCIEKFDKYYAESEKYIASLRLPNDDVSEHKKAVYASCINCALSNYKEKGDFKGFLAGLVYQFPARTYFRDGYWTVLPVLAVQPKLVRNEIITLSKGINEKGECPSAVKFNFKNYWGNHYDSPSFFVLMLYDYMAHTGDFDILKEPTKAGSILDAAVLVMDRLEKEADETGLLVKGGEYNRRDWCDNVFRGGYVTYDEALYARAMQCLGRIFEKTGNKEKADGYYKKYEKIVNAINEILWDEEKGYFVNYKDGDFVEDNLSVDTVPIVLYKLTTEERAKRMLLNMEKTLETRNNKEQSAGDFGVLSVYPFYKNNEAVVQKSSLPYYYHNGGDWPYLSATYAYAKLSVGMDYEYPLTRWFDYNILKGNYTPVEFFSPCHKDGSLMQAWSAMGALALCYPDGRFFDKQL